MNGNGGEFEVASTRCPKKARSIGGSLAGMFSIGIIIIGFVLPLREARSAHIALSHVKLLSNGFSIVATPGIIFSGLAVPTGNQADASAWCDDIPSSENSPTSDPMTETQAAISVGCASALAVTGGGITPYLHQQFQSATPPWPAPYSAGAEATSTPQF